jgi:hypothetical protein
MRNEKSGVLSQRPSLGREAKYESRSQGSASLALGYSHAAPTGP